MGACVAAPVAKESEEQKRTRDVIFFERCIHWHTIWRNGTRVLLAKYGALARIWKPFPGELWLCEKCYASFMPFVAKLQYEFIDSCLYNAITWFTALGHDMCKLIAQYGDSGVPMTLSGELSSTINHKDPQFHMLLEGQKITEVMQSSHDYRFILRLSNGLWLTSRSAPKQCIMFSDCNKKVRPDEPARKYLYDSGCYTPPFEQWMFKEITQVWDHSNEITQTYDPSLRHSFKAGLSNRLRPKLVFTGFEELIT